MKTTYLRFLEAARLRSERIAKWHAEGKTTSEIGRRLKISRQRVDQILAQRRKREGVA